MTGPETGSELPGPPHLDQQTGETAEAEVGHDDHAGRAERLDDTPRIWVGSWLDYNNGILHGRWIDAAQDEVGLVADISAMLTESPTTAETGEPAEDWGIFDYDNFGALRIGEQEDLAWVSAVARGIRQHGLAFAAYADVMQEEEALAGFEDDYLGHYDSLDNYVRQYVEEAGYEQLLDEALPDSLRPYVKIDTAQLAYDMQLGGDVHVLPVEDGGVWIFQSR